MAAKRIQKYITIVLLVIFIWHIPDFKFTPRYCWPTWNWVELCLTRALIQMVFLFLIPFPTLMYLSYRLSQIIRRPIKSTKDKSDENFRLKIEAARNKTRMLILLVIVYLLTGFPGSQFNDMIELSRLFGPNINCFWANRQNLRNALIYLGETTVALGNTLNLPIVYFLDSKFSNTMNRMIGL